MTDLSVHVGQLTLKNPVLTASGCFGYGLEYDDFFDVSELGGICTKGLSLKPRPGNPPERIAETPAGMLNAIGLANVGVEAFCRDKLPILRERKVGVIANIFASSVDAAASRALARSAPPASCETRTPSASDSASAMAIVAMPAATAARELVPAFSPTMSPSVVSTPDVSPKPNPLSAAAPRPARGCLDAACAAMSRSG